jgi:DNA-binding IclR family transcriptional regulator
MTDNRRARVTEEKAQQRGIQSVEVAMRVLEAIERIGGAAPLSRVANEADMGPSTAHRYLVSLTRIGLVAQDAATGWYDLGPAARRLGLEAVRRADDVSLAGGAAALLRDATGHTVNVSVWGESGPTIVRWEHGRYPLPIVARVGSTLPLVDTSVGRIFLAYVPEQMTQPVLRSQQRHEVSSRPTPEVLAGILDEVRQEGVSKTAGGVIPGLTVLAAPVFSTGGALSAVVAVLLLTRTATPAAVGAAGKQLTATTDKVSVDLGGPTAAQMRDVAGLGVQD